MCPIEAMQKISAMIAGMDYDERSALPCIGNERADLVVAGCAILEAIIEIWPAQEPRRRRPRHPRRHSALADGARRLAIVKRLKTAKGRKVSSTRWLERQLNDPYVKRAKAENYRSRAAYKLLELDERFGLLKGVKAVVDLGIAPGGWSQVVRRKAPQASIVGIDLLPTDPIDGVTILQMDFMDEAAPERLKEALGGPADLVLSDMAANTVGHQQTDHLRTMALVEAGLEFAREVLRPGGAYVAKVLAGGADNQLVAELKRNFTTVKHAKPPASRKDSSEWYVDRAGLQGVSGRMRSYRAARRRRAPSRRR